MTSLRHLARRFVGSLSRREPTAGDTTWARGMLLDHEWALWSRMDVRDRRHSVEVARRFVSMAVDPPRTAVAGALLHDVGKTDASLGTMMRVVATVVGPRTERFRRYHDHERLGADSLAEAGSAPDTVALVRGEGEWVRPLRRADDV